jgi:hypothetical protein
MVINNRGPLLKVIALSNMWQLTQVHVLLFPSDTPISTSVSHSLDKLKLEEALGKRQHPATQSRGRQGLSSLFRFTDDKI